MNAQPREHGGIDDRVRAFVEARPCAHRFGANGAEEGKAGRDRPHLDEAKRACAALAPVLAMLTKLVW